MKNKTICIFILYATLCAFNEVKAQQGTWTLMHGTTLPNTDGDFGIKGVASPTNNPPALYEAAEWTDHQGNFWIYGGLHPVAYSALWKFEPATNMWTWVQGPDTAITYAVYGTKGVPDTANNPGAHSFGALTWTDLQNNLWLFGGANYDNYSLSDLWKYNISTNTWTWMSGPNTGDPPGSYGIMGTPSISNYPPNRSETNASWVDANGNLWLFGGMGRIGGTIQKYNDLWRYDISTNMWTWMKGDSIGNSMGNYGVKGVPAISNEPSGRCVYSKWKDADGNFWLFGGWGVNWGFFNDLWKYDLTTNMWTWINGSNLLNDPGNYGTICNSTNTNCPVNRMENKACWTDANNNFWLFGGLSDNNLQLIGLNDLWYYNVQQNQWTWVNGGTGPSERNGAVSFYDSNGNLWVFGGQNVDNYGVKNYNDLWLYEPDTTCKALTTLVQTTTEPCPTKDCLVISPNPNNGIFNVQAAEDINDYSITITDMFGRKVFYKTYMGSTPELINISNQGNGLYIVLVSNKGTQYRSKVFVNK